MNTRRRLSSIFVVLAMMLGLTSIASPAQAATCADGSTGCTSVSNSLNSYGSIQVRYNGFNYMTLVPGQGKVVPKGQAIYWRFTSTKCEMKQISPTGFMSLSQYKVNVWYKALNASSTKITIDCR